MKNWIAICPAHGAEVSGHGSTVEGGAGGKRIKHAALLLLVEEEDFETMGDRGKIHAKEELMSDLLDMGKA